MSFLSSTGSKNQLMAALITLIDGGLLKIYGDATSQSAANALIPTTASDALGAAILLCTVSVNGAGTGITMDPTPTGGVIVKTTTEAWRGDNVASGYSSFYRIAPSADDGTASTTAERFQGTVGILGTDLIIASAYLTLGEEQRVDSYTVGFPVG